MPKEKVCCPKFDPAPWNEKILNWQEKKFVKAKVRTFMFMPLNFGSVMRKMDQKIRNADAKIENNLTLSDHTSRFNMNLYLAVDKEVPNLENITLNGKFLSKVYEGDFKETGKWCQDFEKYAKTKGYNIKKWYMWYTTCPKCAKKYGKNYVVIIGKIN